MTKATPADDAATQSNQAKANGQAPGRVITNSNEVAHLVMMQIDNVNSKKDELTIAVKTLADTTKQLVSVYANQQAQIAQLSKQVEDLGKEKRDK